MWVEVRTATESGRPLIDWLDHVGKELRPFTTIFRALSANPLFPMTGSRRISQSACHFSALCSDSRGDKEGKGRRNLTTN